MNTKDIILIIMASILFISFVGMLIKSMFIKDMDQSSADWVGNVLYLITGSLLGYVSKSIKKNNNN